MSSHLYLVDASTYIYRAYHALPPLTRKTDGAPIGAVHGFCAMILKHLLPAWRCGDPSHIGIVFDPPGRSFRSDIHPEYKANRPPAPEDLVAQFSIIREAVAALGLCGVEAAGFEADDLIASYRDAALRAGFKVTLLSSDKDLMQLIDDDTLMLDPFKDAWIDAAGTVEKFGVPPDKAIDVQALAGDPTDNIPGVPGIGVKTAAQLIDRFGSLDALLDNLDAIAQPKRRALLIANAEAARMSRRLATLRRDVPLPVDLDAMATGVFPVRSCLAFMRAQTFNALTRRVGEIAAELGLEVEDEWKRPAAESARQAGDDRGNDENDRPAADPAADSAANPEKAAAAALEAAATPPVERRYDAVVDAETLRVWLERADDRGKLAVSVETDSPDPMRAAIVGIALAVAPAEAAYVPFAHRPDAEEADIFSSQGQASALPIFSAQRNAMLDVLRPILGDSSILKISWNGKDDTLILARHGIDLTPCDDVTLLSYCLESGASASGHGMTALSRRWLECEPLDEKERPKEKKRTLRFDEISIEAATPYAGEKADLAFRLHGLLKAKLLARGLTSVYETLERPLIATLAAMQTVGIRIDPVILADLSQRFGEKIAAIETEIHRLAGETFTIGSPKQLADILFHKMSIPLIPGAKTSKGSLSTDAGVLETLAAQGHDIAARVLDWRQWSKLKNTYADALQTCVHPKTGRIHTSYASASTTTGRLSSSDPNLQNIPIRSAAGREIRTAFIADRGCKLISADYSQIELRLLAHIAEVDALRDAFRADADIHARTASEVFGIAEADVDPTLRRRAKAVNFGIVYGISSFGLANQLHIPRAEAGALIDAYFKRFPQIRDYMEDVKRRCRECGYVETIFGRRCHYPHIGVGPPHRRAFLERAAVNAPIQGSAADLIRRAMIRLPESLAAKGLRGRLLLQVHDELIVEAPDDEIDPTVDAMRGVMTGAARPACELSVPLRVDIAAADNWREAH